MFKFIHAADIHLDSPLHGLERYEGAPVDEIRGATRRALDNLVQLAIDEEVSFVLIAGDLYDGSWRDHNTGLFFVSRIVKLRDAGIPVFAISGNHDAASKMTKSLRIPPNPDGTPVMLSYRRPETIVLDQFDVAIHGQGFATAAVNESVIPNYPAARTGQFNIGILHTSLEDPAGEHPRYAPCTISELAAKEYQYWALGHIHTKRDIRQGNSRIVFPGNIQGRHIREPGERGCMLVIVDDRFMVQPEFRALDVFRWQLCEIPGSGVQRSEDILERFAAELSSQVAANDGLPMAVRIVVTGRCPAHQRLLSDSVAWTNELRAVALDVGGGNVWLERVKFQTTPERELDEKLLAEGPMGELVSLIRDLRVNGEPLLDLSKEFEELERKLPDDLKLGPEALRLRDLGQLRLTLDEVQSLLLERLQPQGAEQ